MKNFKSLLILAAVIAAVAIAAIIYTVVFSNPKTEQVATNTTNTPPETPAKSESNNTKTYTDTTNKYSFEYPNTLTSGKEDLTYLPYGNQEVAVDSSLMHEAKAQYCAASGECTPTTRDFSFDSSVIDSPLGTVKSKLGTEAKTETIGDYAVVTLTQGVEGEGVNYYFIALPNNKTLMFDQRYIDESVNPKYQKVTDFIPFAKQNQMMRDIISSLTFTK